MPTKGRKKAVGICALTGRSGEFVKSHILPRALTKPSRPGSPIIEAGNGKRPSRQWDSWYDDRLVILYGEKILAALDNWAIPVLRDRELVWSGWKSPDFPKEGHQPFTGTPHGMRSVTGLDTDRLRLFFLSLLWRAAASTKPQFKDIQLPANYLSELGRMLVEGDPGKTTYFPIELFQLSTISAQFNRAALAIASIASGWRERTFRVSAPQSSQAR